jgi:hypothetical protein
VLPSPAVSLKARWVARLGALFYFAWGLFHLKVAHDIYPRVRTDRHRPRTCVSTCRVHAMHYDVCNCGRRIAECGE